MLRWCTRSGWAITFQSSALLPMIFCMYAEKVVVMTVVLAHLSAEFVTTPLRPSSTSVHQPHRTRSALPGRVGRPFRRGLGDARAPFPGSGRDRNGQGRLLSASGASRDR